MLIKFPSLVAHNYSFFHARQQCYVTTNHQTIKPSWVPPPRFIFPVHGSWTTNHLFESWWIGGPRPPNGNHTALAKKKLEKNRMETKSQKHGCSIGFGTPCAAAENSEARLSIPSVFFSHFLQQALQDNLKPCGCREGLLPFCSDVVSCISQLHIRSASQFLMLSKIANRTGLGVYENIEMWGVWFQPPDATRLH